MLLVGDAMAVGGPAFVEELHYAAMEAAGAVVPWDGNVTSPLPTGRSGSPSHARWSPNAG